MAKALQLPGTADTRRLCEEISQRTGGVCLLAFSRGKDSLAAWLFLRQFFERIIPFHLATVPHLDFVDRSLIYYEQYFETKIERLMFDETWRSFDQGWYQPPDDMDELEDLGWADYDIVDVADLLRDKYGVPDAFCAAAIGRFDSLFRRTWFNSPKTAVNEEKYQFYPIYDWTLKQILGSIKSSGLKLAPDYLIGVRTVHGVPNIRHLERWKKVFPEDYKRMQALYPLIEARLARNEFRRRRAERERSARRSSEASRRRSLWGEPVHV